MPNFNTHWLVALRAIPSAPRFVQDGFSRFRIATVRYKKTLTAVVEDATDRSKSGLIRGAISDARDKWVTLLQTDGDLPGTWDDVTCFSAYMLGACGPDFWTLPSISKHGKVPDFAAKHFDLGHYNRTHRQFQVSVPRVAGRDDLQARVEQSYFLGMATHLAADLVIHQLVNVYAGAYNLLEKRWENEQGSLVKNIWSTHNKVEHYWDSYVRYRLLGDLDPIFDGPDPGGDADGWGVRLGFPVRESLVRLVERTRTGKARKVLLDALNDDAVRHDIEKPLMFPWVFCDRVGDAKKPGDLAPFIYDVVVRKDSGAYPTAEVHADASSEAGHFQMQDVSAGRSERKKLAFFTSERNTKIPNTSHNYLTYLVCPDLEKVKRFAGDQFFELAGLRTFVDRAASLAQKFVNELSGAYRSAGLRGAPPDSVRLPMLGRFWNLDTGLGLRVTKLQSQTACEAITSLDFVHALDVAAAGTVQFDRNPGYLQNRTAKTWAFEKKEAFPTDETRKVFPNLAAVTEEDGAYLSQILLSKPETLPAHSPKLDALFHPPPTPRAKVVDVPTLKLAASGAVRVSLQDVHHRLSLWLRVPIAAVGPADGKGPEKLGLFLYGDRKPGLDGATKELPQPKGSDSGLREEIVTTHEWWANVKGAGLLDYHEVKVESAVSSVGLRSLRTPILSNLEPSKALARKTKAGEWNNVVPYEKHSGHYGRNFVVGTGRTHVLAPSNSGNFDGKKHFDCYSNVSPTEQVFLSIFPLVRTHDGVFDVFSKEKVSEDQLPALTRIDATGFVKVVLAYDLGPDGAAHFDACYVDGLRVPIETA